jgi:integrase
MARPNNGPRLKADPKTGIFYIVWSEARRTKRVSTGTANLLEAQKVFAGYLMERQQADERFARWTVGMVIDYYDTNHIAEDVVAKKRQRRALDRVRAVLGEDAFIDGLASDAFTRYRIQRRQDENSQGKPISDGTIRRELNSFAAACNFAVRNRKIDNRRVPVITLPDHAPSRERWLTKDEAQALLQTAQGERERLTPIYRLVAIALATAKRRRAIEALKWFQVDLKNRVIDFRSKDAAETKKRKGTSQISDWLLPILERAYREKRSEYVLDVPGVRTMLFREVADLAGMPDVTAHTLRHTWGTWAAQGGMSMWHIAGVMECSVATAEKNYLHHSPENLRAAVNRVSPEESLGRIVGHNGGR